MSTHEKFPQQTAPDKNTDNAFVKVSKDGSPQFPGKPEEKKEETKDKPRSQPPGK